MLTWSSGDRRGQACKRNGRRLVPDPVWLVRPWCWASSGSITARRSSLSALSVEALSMMASQQLIEQRSRVYQVPRVEAFGEPAVDWGEKATGFIDASSVVP